MKIRFRVFVFSIILILGSTIFCSAQITDKDEADALKLARRFSRRLKQTKDIKPLIPEFFAENFISKSLIGHDGDYFAAMTTEVARNMDDKSLTRWYIAFFNWNYLSTIYFYSKSSSVSDDQLPLRKALPADVWRVVRREPGFYLEDDKSESQYLKNIEQVRRNTETLERASLTLRKHVQKLENKPTPQLRESLADWGKRFGGFYDPDSFLCDKECYGLPTGTQYFDIMVFPAFDLRIARTGKQMKILEAGPHYD